MANTFIERIKLILTGAKKATKDAKKFETGLKKIQNAAVMAGGSFFAAQGLIQGFKHIINLSMETEKVAQGFMNLGKEFDISRTQLVKLRQAVNGTMNDMELMTLSNQAMALGVATSNEQLADMFDKAQQLGRALGVDTTNALQSLVTGMGRQCLTGDSIVLLENGTKTIKEIKKGDIVVSYHKDKGFIKTEVSHLLDNGIQPVFELICEDNNKIKSTDNHRYLTDKGWKELKDINIGDLILNADGNYSTVKSINFLNKERVYDLTVPETENFFANGLCVHNSILMLDNLGIMVDAKVAYENYATQMGIVGRALDDQEKKLAFNAEVMNQLNESTKKLGDEQLSTAEKIDALTTDIERGFSASGRMATRMIASITDGLADMGVTAEAGRLDMTEFLHAIFDLEEIKSIDVMKNEVRGLVVSMHDLSNAGDIEKWTEDWDTANATGVEGIKERMGLMANFITKQEEAGELNTYEIDLLKAYMVELGEMLAMEELRAEKKQEWIEHTEEATVAMEQETEMFVPFIDATNQATAATENFNREKEKQLDLAKELTKQVVSSAMAVGGAEQDAARAAGMAATQFILAQLQKAIAAYIADSFAKFGIFGAIGAAAAGGIVGNVFERARQGAIQSFSVGTAAEGMNQIVTEPTLILAGEAGPEYVDIEPTVNEGAGRGGANIVFQGNVMSDDFIVEQAIPKIREALRRGESLGIS